MKVLTLGRLPHAEVGGLPMYTANLGAALVAAGVELTVVQPGSPAPAGRYPFAVRQPAEVAWPAAGRLRSFRQAFAVAREARTALRELTPDVVHLQYGGAMDLALLRGIAGRGGGSRFGHRIRFGDLGAVLDHADKADEHENAQNAGSADLEPLHRLPPLAALHDSRVRFGQFYGPRLPEPARGPGRAGQF